jgi:hypothetical protein
MEMHEIEKMVADGKLIKHHTAATRRYVSRRKPATICTYKGRFGRGYIALSPRWDTSQYCWITYYIES